MAAAILGPATRIGAMLVLAAGLGSAIARADPLNDGTQAFADKDYATALRRLAPLADAGDPVAGCMVKVMRDQAQRRVAYDFDAMAGTCTAAARGKAWALLGLAGNYRTGLILDEDVVKAARLYARAADQGSPVAQKVLGDLYAAGEGVEQDLATACRWWGRAAMQGGLSEAQRNFGNCYLSGIGVAHSEMQALAWWLIARNDEAQNTDGLPSWVFQRDADADRLADDLMQRMPESEVVQAQAIARAWHPKPE